MSKYIVTDGMTIWGLGDSKDAAIEDLRSHISDEDFDALGDIESRIYRGDGSMVCLECTDALANLVDEKGGAKISFEIDRKTHIADVDRGAA